MYPFKRSRMFIFFCFCFSFLLFVASDKKRTTHHQSTKSTLELMRYAKNRVDFLSTTEEEREKKTMLYLNAYLYFTWFAARFGCLPLLASSIAYGGLILYEFS